MKIEQIKEFLEKEAGPFVVLLIGPPLSGKDTFIRNIKLDSVEVISRDDIIMSLVSGQNYNEAYKKVDHGKVDSILVENIMDAIRYNRNVIINMTNMRIKGRKRHLRKFPDSYKRIGIIFPLLEGEEYIRRNKERELKEGKYIGEEIIRGMIQNYQPISESENFDRVINFDN